ncbi:hypothetical protein, partial [Vibrio sp. S234-5]|uniref:hypothetical protein n=1 Tax=Vibrio sp. S234-5 TaxID=1616781 RepID=UPI0005EDB615
MKNEFESAYPGFITYGHLWGARDKLITSGDMVWTGSCFALEDMGCMFSNDKSDQSNLYSSAIQSALAYDVLWSSNNILALVTPTYLANYEAQVASLDAI